MFGALGQALPLNILRCSAVCERPPSDHELIEHDVLVFRRCPRRVAAAEERAEGEHVNRERIDITEADIAPVQRQHTVEPALDDPVAAGLAAAGVRSPSRESG